MDKDDRLSEDYIKDIYWDVDLKKAEEDFKNNGYKFRENDDLEKLPTAKKSDPPTSKVESPKKATVTKNKPGPKSKTKISEEGQEDSAVKKNKPGPKSKKDTKSQEIRYVIVDLDFFFVKLISQIGFFSIFRLQINFPKYNIVFGSQKMMRK